MAFIKTESGFEVNIDPECIADMRTLRILSQISDTDLNLPEMKRIMLTDAFAKSILSPEDYCRLNEHVADKDGRIPATAYFAEVFDIIKSFSENSKK